MRIIITGGTGFIGSYLGRSLIGDGHSVVILTRNRHREKQSTDTMRFVYWNPPETDGIDSVLGESDGIVNLAGASIAGQRWTATHKKRILDSRIQVTRALVDAVLKAQKKPPVLVSASGIHIHDHMKEAVYTELSEAGDDFLATVCKQWEAEARRAESEGVRVCIVRFGIVLGESGGALQRMLLPFKLFAGGPLGSGDQWMPWVHIDDVIGIIRFAIENGHVNGPLNATSPDQVTNKEFSKVLGAVLRRPSFMPAPAFALRLMLGEMADVLLLNGQKVLPERTRELGYQFKYTDLEKALRDILKR